MSEQNLIKGEAEHLPASETPLTSSTEERQADSGVPVDEKVYVKRGLIFLLVTFGVFVLWATLVPLSSAVVAGGKLVVDTNSKSIQHYEGGIIENILVENGQAVEAGEALIQLETTQWESELSMVTERLYSTLAEIDRLGAEQRFARQLNFSDELQQVAQDNPDLQRILEQQRQLFTARMEAYQQKRGSLAQRISQIEEQIKGLREQEKVLKEHLASLEEEQKAYSALFEEDLGDGQRARELNRSALRMKNELTRVRSEASRLAIKVTETELELATQQQEYLKEVSELLKQRQVEYFDLQSKRRIAADRLERATVRAPEAGVIVNLKVHTIGGVAPSGQTLLDLVPVGDQFVIEAEVRPQDINLLYVGQLADVRFSAFDSQVTKVIQAEVSYISADRLTNEREGTAYYIVRLKLTEQGRKDLGDKLELKAGMPVEVMIRGADRTFLSYLFKPLSDSVARGMKEQ